MIALWQLRGGAAGIIRILITGFIVGAAAWVFALEVGNRQGRAELELEQAAASARIEKERVVDDKVLQTLDDYDLCARYYRDRRLPIDACDPLRGVPVE